MVETRAPVAVSKAVRLLYFYIGAKALMMVAENISVAVDGSWGESITRVNEQFPGLGYWFSAVGVAVMVSIFVFFYFVVWKIKHGRNWARYCLLGMFILRAGYEIIVWATVLKSSGSVMVIGEPATVIREVLLALFCYAVCLLFSQQSAEWFRGRLSVVS